MLNFFSLSRAFVTNIVAPPPLKGLPASWTGIFKRLVIPTRKINDPNIGTYSITVLSRDEYRRLVEHNHDAMLAQYPGRHSYVYIVDSKSEKNQKTTPDTINDWVKSKFY